MPIKLHSFGVCGFTHSGEIYIIGGITIDKQKYQYTVKTIYIYNIQ